MILIAILKSRLELSFGSSAGARFSVMRFLGNVMPLDAKAERSRSLASSTALLARPTIIMLGRPLDICDSALTSKPSMPLSQIL